MESKGKVTVYHTECSPSHLPSNLSSSNSTLFFIHNSESQPRVMTINKKLFDSESQPSSSFVCSFNTSEGNEMLCVRVVNLNQSYYLAIGLYNGFKLWSIDGNRLLFQIPAKVKIQERPYAFVSLCEFQMLQNSKGYDSLLACDNYCQLFIVHGQSNNWKSKVILTTIKESGVTIASHLGSFYVGIAYDSNKVSLFRLENGKCGLLKSFENDNLGLASCIVKTTTKDAFYYCVGFINGEVKMYNFDSTTLDFSIASHLRMINCIVEIEDCFATGSDDGCVNVWRIKDKKVVIDGNYPLEDKLITGIVYDNDKRALFVNCYDHPEMNVIAL